MTQTTVSTIELQALADLIRSSKQQRAYPRLLVVWLGLLTLLFVGMVWILLSLLNAVKPTACYAGSPTCYDSGWKPVSNKDSTAYFFRHSLGTTPAHLDIWFSPTADGARSFLMTSRFPDIRNGNPVTVEARADAVYVNVWKGAPIASAFDGPKEAWTSYNQGFYRVVATK